MHTKTNIRYVLMVTFALLLGISGTAQTSFKKVYKTINNQELTIECFTPSTPMPAKGYPTIVFFHGGGWKHGKGRQFIKNSIELCKKGMVAINVIYRTEANAGTTPKEALIDAKSAMRYIKEHAEELKVDTHKIAASGGSAGGHLAAASCYCQKINDPNDNLDISPRPTALVLYNPVIDNSSNGYGYDRVKDYYKDFSPLHNIKDPVPTIFFLGTKDKLIPVSTAKAYKAKCESLGGRCELKLYEGCSHGFFNKEKYKETLAETIQFLKSLGYIE